jgi:hypothetical protein
MRPPLTLLLLLLVLLLLPLSTERESLLEETTPELRVHQW